MARPTVGLALGGGSARGWAHIGVLNTLIAAGLEPDVVAGTSIGSVAGACFVTGNLNRLENFARSLTPRRIFGFLDFNLAGSGLITGQRLSGELEDHLKGLKIENLDPRFVAVATELGTGHEVWLNEGDLVKALNASFALPGIFKPVRINGQWMIDGALVDQGEVVDHLGLRGDEIQDAPGLDGEGPRQVAGPGDIEDTSGRHGVTAIEC